MPAIRSRSASANPCRLVLCLILLLTIGRAQEEEKKTWDPEVKWARAVEDFSKQDAANPPPPGAVVFYGSSSFRMWDLERFFPDRSVINRGFGGSTMPDALHFAERWVIPLKPGCILIYEGDNDIKNGWTADEVSENFQRLVDTFAEALPGTPVIFVAIKPSISRWTMWPEMRKANDQIATICDRHDHLHFADIAEPMFEYNGLPKSFLYKPDGLHLNDVGYEVWHEVIDPLIDEAMGATDAASGSD